MGEPAMSAQRPTQLSSLAKGVVIFMIAASFITGFMTSEMLEGQDEDGTESNVLINRIRQIDPELLDSENPPPPSPKPDPLNSTPYNWRGLHGLTSPFLAVLFGWLIFQHARGGWSMRTNIWTGMPLVIIFGGLIVTGAFILYPELFFGLVDPQSHSNWLKETHDLLGWIFLVGFICHLLGAKYFKKNL